MIARNAAMTHYLASEYTPLFSLDELAQLLTFFVAYTCESGNKTMLIEIGHPALGFPGSPWLGRDLQALYYVRPSTGVIESRSGKEPVERRHFWRSTSEGSDDELVSYEQADFLPQLNSDDVARLQGTRSAIYQLKIDILGELTHALRFRDAEKVWRNCMGIIGKLSRGECRYYLGVDARFSGFDIVTAHWRDPESFERPGGLSSLFRLIAHVEEELRHGVFAKTREALGTLVTWDADGTADLAIENYLLAIGDGNHRAIDGGLAVFERYIPHYEKAYRILGRRIVRSIEEHCDETTRLQRTSDVPQPRELRGHSPDFRTVRWDGEIFAFNATQARVIAPLWQEYEAGGRGLGALDLQEQADSGANRFRLRDVFRGPPPDRKVHPAWGRMIVRLGRGVYALAPLPRVKTPE